MRRERGRDSEKGKRMSFGGGRNAENDFLRFGKER